MKALVTGTSGFIGSHLTEALLGRGYEVRCLLRKSSKLTWIDPKSVEVASSGFDDPEALRRAVEGVDVIYHVAGVTASKTQEGFFQGNQVATRNLVQAAADVGTVKRFLHMSSMAAVGPASKGSPVDETTPCRPITTYARSKKAAEDEVLKMSDRLAITIVRPPAVYGPRDVGVFEFFKTVKMGILPLIGFDHKLVSLVHSRDLVRGTILATESERGAGETFFISSEEFYDWRGVGEIAKKVLGTKTITVHVPHPVVYLVASLSQFFGRFSANAPILDREKGTDIVQPYWICSVEKAKRLLGYRQEVSLEQGIRETVAWYREQKWL
jgi:dihydroflavonol-4-reductase